MKRFAVVLGVLFLGFVLVSFSYLSPPASQKPFSFGSNEKPSPNNWLDEEQIKVLRSMVVIKQENVTLTTFADTNSMDPLLDENSNGLEIKPEKNKLQPGDVISYKSNLVSGTVIHRIIEINEDEKGTYYLTQGDNSRGQEKVRFEQVEGVLIGVLY